MNDNAALLMIDVQNDFCPDGALAVADGDEVVSVINRIQEHFSVKVLTQDWHPDDHTSFAANHEDAQPFTTTKMSYGEQILWPTHCVQGTHGAAFHSGLITDSADLIIRKGFRPEIDSYSAFFENDQRTSTGLAGYLNGRKVRSVYLTGLATDYCVYYSALDAVKLGLEVTVLTDCCRAIDMDGSLDAAIKDMANLGVTLTDSTRLWP